MQNCHQCTSRIRKSAEKIDVSVYKTEFTSTIIPDRMCKNVWKRRNRVILCKKNYAVRRKTRGG